MNYFINKMLMNLNLIYFGRIKSFVETQLHSLTTRGKRMMLF